MKNLKTLGLCSCLSLALFGVGCGSVSQPKSYLVEKQNCAKYIPILESKIEKDDEELNSLLSDGRSTLTTLVKVCYSILKSTCLAGTNTSAVSKGNTTFFRSIADVLTNQVLISESEKAQVSDVDELIQQTSAFRDETSAKMDALGCVN